MWVNRALAGLLLALVAGQGALGWVVRQQPGWLPYHLLFGIAVLLPAALHQGLRAAFAAGGRVRELGLAVSALVAAQLLVGWLCYLVPRTVQAGRLTGTLDRGLVWLHWCVGLATLATAIALVASTWRVPDAAHELPDRPTAPNDPG